MSDSRVLVVTGGSRGIGARVVEHAVAQDWRVCFSYLAAANEANAVVAQCEALGGSCDAVRAGVSREADVLKLFRGAEALGPIGGVVANAGIIAPPLPLREFSEERVRRLLEVNVLGTILCCREAVRLMSTAEGRNGGSIVMVSSAASRIGSPCEYVDYAASKGALDSLTIGLSREVAADGIRVNAVRPGTTRTEIHERNGQGDRMEEIASRIPLGRVAEPEEVAAAIVWLLSDAASYCTGTILDVAGGR